MTIRILRLALFAALCSVVAPQAFAQPKPPKSLRLYIFDCGALDMPDPLGRYNLKREEIVTNWMSVPCFLIAHPKGTLMWDVGVIPDAMIKGDGTMAKLNYAQSSKKLIPQLAAAGYKPSDITYFSLSHFHYDHVANANEFASATWLVRQKERDIMFMEPPSERTVPANYAALKNAKTTIVKDDEYDVFGDGTVVLKSAPGHSPDHQVLYLKFKKTGPVLLSGDLYHYPEERKLDRYPNTEFDAAQTKVSRGVIEAYLKKTGAQLWIQHDFTGTAKLKKAPQFYE